MVNAGPPARPGDESPRLSPVPESGTHSPAPAVTTTVEASSHEPSAQDPDSPFARLTANATFRVPDPDTDSPVAAGDWCDPDPEAGLALGTGRTPYERALGRRKAGTSRDAADSAFRMARRILAGDEEVDVSHDALAGFAWHHLDVETAQNFMVQVNRRYTKQSTRNDKVCVVRGAINECYKFNLISVVRREQLLDALYTTAPGRSHRRHRITDAEFDALMSSCLETGNAFARARNAAIVALFRTTGLRVSELVALELTDWNRREDTLALRDTKNRDTHTLYLHPATKVLLISWLEVRGPQPGKLFHAASRPCEVAMRPTSIRFMLTSRCRTAGIEPFGTHDFRRTFATELLRLYDASLVSKLLNHRKLTSTLIYDMATDDEMRNAVGSIRLSARHTDGAA